MNTSPLFRAAASAHASPGGQSHCLANATLVLAEQEIRGRVVFCDGLIVDVQEGDTVPDGATNCAGDRIMPGLVELHTDNLERHLEPRPAVDWPHKAAILAHDAELASTGITTVFDALRVGSLLEGQLRNAAYARKLADELRAVREADALRISHFLHLRAEICSQTLSEEMAEFCADDHVGIVSLMDHTPGQRQFRDMSALKAYLTKKRSMSDEEFEAHVNNLKDLQKRYRQKHEKCAVSSAARFGAVLASHDDTTAEQVSVSKGHGVQFAEFPTTLEAAEACHEHGIAVTMGAPNIIRGRSHSGNVSAHKLAQAGLLDIVSSDYVPSALLLAAFQLAALWQDVPRAMACVTHNPARAVGLDDRGRLEPGLRADVLRVGMLGGTPLLRGVWSGGVRVG